MSGPEASSSDRPAARQVAVAAALGGFLAAIVILIHSGGDKAEMVFGDGRLYRLVASDITATDPAIQAEIATRGTSLRYGRIGLPAVLWAASAGRRAAMPYAQPAIMMISALAIAAATRMLFPKGSFLLALSPFIAVGLTVAFTGGFAEPLAVAAALWAVVLLRHAGPWPAAGALAFAMLTRESAGAVLAGLVLWSLVCGRRREGLILSASLVPVAGWYVYVAARFGHIPFLDPWSGAVSDSIGVPVVTAFRSIANTDATAAVVIVVHLLLAAYAFTQWRSSDLGAVAAACGLSVLLLGNDVWRFIGDATRVASLLEVFVLLAVVQRFVVKDIDAAVPSGREPVVHKGTPRGVPRTPGGAVGMPEGSAPR